MHLPRLAQGQCTLPDVRYTFNLLARSALGLHRAASPGSRFAELRTEKSTKALRSNGRLLRWRIPLPVRPLASRQVRNPA
jgi:hypothetical protein